MQLSVVILNYNVRYFLELCVSSVQKALENINGEIIVIDNNSTDDSCEMMKRRFPNIKLIENKENSGFPKGNNIGFAHAQGEYICILNPDTVVAEDTFTKVLAFAKEQIELGIVGTKLIDGIGNFLPESKRGIPTPFVAFTKITGAYKIFPKSRTFGKYYAQHLSENETGKVEILVGAFMLMKRELYNEVGGFDENCFMYSDDIDLSYRVLQQGKSNYYFHETTVIHYKGESTVKDKMYMNRFQEAMHFFYKKHFQVSVPFSLFMKMGIAYFSLVKTIQGKPIQKTSPENYILISDNEILKEKLERSFKKPVKLQNWNPEIINFTKSFSKNQNTEIIFDQNHLDFKTIIEAFETYKRKGFSFKIAPKNAGFLIGSNSSFDRGEIIKV
jgi:GT2 family glycosyltransferase